MFLVGLTAVNDSRCGDLRLNVQTTHHHRFRVWWLSTHFLTFKPIFQGLTHSSMFCGMNKVLLFFLKKHDVLDNIDLFVRLQYSGHLGTIAERP